MGKSSPKEQEWRQIFIEVRRETIRHPLGKSRTMLKYKDFRVNISANIRSLDVKLGWIEHLDKRESETDYNCFILKHC